MGCTKMKRKILIVDDEESIATLLKYNIEQAGYDTDVVYDGKSAFDKGMTGGFDLIVLDVMLPHMDGMDVVKQLRQQQVETPILMLTAKDEEFDKVLGLELGADDYLTKPFSPREVVARIKAILRRTNVDREKDSSESNEEKIAVSNLTIFPDKYEAYIEERQLEFTPKEFELLVYLGRHRGRVLSRDQLLSAVWDYDFVGDTRIVDVHVSHLREKIEPDTKKPTFIKTIRGLGYKLEEPK